MAGCVKAKTTEWGCVIQTFSLMHFCHKYFSSINSGGVLDPV